MHYTLIGIIPYRRAFLRHLLRLELLTAFCALFGLVRWRVKRWDVPRDTRLLDNMGMAIDLRGREVELKGAK